MSEVARSRINVKCLVRDSNQEGRSQNSQMQWGLYAKMEEQEFGRGIEMLESWQNTDTICGHTVS